MANEIESDWISTWRFRQSTPTLSHVSQARRFGQNAQRNVESFQVASENASEGCEGQRPIQGPPKDNPDFMDISDADFEAIETKIANAKV